MISVSAEELRRQKLEARARLSDLQRQAHSQRIQQYFLRSRFFFRATHIGCYIATPLEVDTSLIFDRAWRTGKRIYAPVAGRNGHMRFIETRPGTRLIRNRFGLWEPESGEEIVAQKLKIVVTPTVVFDNRRQRIGMGGGYYDRAFRTNKNKRNYTPAKLIGFAFDCQKIEEIPANPWDIPLYRVVTENGST